MNEHERAVDEAIKKFRIGAQYHLEIFEELERHDHNGFAPILEPLRRLTRELNDYVLYQDRSRHSQGSEPGQDTDSNPAAGHGSSRGNARTGQPSHEPGESSRLSRKRGRSPDAQAHSARKRTRAQDVSNDTPIPELNGEVTRSANSAPTSVEAGFTVEYEDISAEVDGRLKAKAARREAEKKEKKRRRRSGDSGDTADPNDGRKWPKKQRLLLPRY